MIEWNFFGFTTFFKISFQVFSDRMSKVQETQTNLLEEVKRESVKFGDDVKYLAEFTSGMKKFDPWIEKAEKKKEKGMPKPNNLEEANDALEDAKVCIYLFQFDGIFFSTIEYFSFSDSTYLHFYGKYFLKNREIDLFDSHSIHCQCM